MFPVSNHTSCETSTNTVKTSNPSIEEAVNEYSKPIENTKYKVQKSTALEKRLAAGETISNFAIGLVDSKCGSNSQSS